MPINQADILRFSYRLSVRFVAKNHKAMRCEIAAACFVSPQIICSACLISKLPEREAVTHIGPTTIAQHPQENEQAQKHFSKSKTIKEVSPYRV